MLRPSCTSGWTRFRMNSSGASRIRTEIAYVRDREREFTDNQPPSKEEALRAFDRTIAMVVATIGKQRAEDWGKAYTAEREPEARDRMQIFIRCAGHAYHHVGQMVYLTRELART